MARGGKRPGAGRKAGALTVKTREVAEKAVATGMAPLDVILENMRHYQKLATDAEAILEGKTAAEIIGGHQGQMRLDEQVAVILAEARKTADLRDRATACARDAAPFCHARLSPVEANKRTDDLVPLAERLKAYQRRDAIAKSGGKVVDLGKKRA